MVFSVGDPPNVASQCAAEACGLFPCFHQPGFAEDDVDFPYGP